MTKGIDVLGNAISILIEKGKLSRDEFPVLHEKIINDASIINDLENLCQGLGLYLNEKSGVFYASPIPGVRTFGYTNEELKKEFGYSFNNEELYVALFIIANVVTEFFPEANLIPARQFLKANDLMEIIDKKINVLSEQANLDEVSYQKSYNFEVVVKKWVELPRIKFDKNDPENIKENGKSSKVQIINTTLRFLENQELIKLIEVNGDKSIYITEKFKATVANAYNNEEIQSEIYSYIDNLIQK